MQRIIVDLPEPEGPQTTTRSPLPTSMLMFLQNVEIAVPFVDVAQLDDRCASVMMVSLAGLC